jgi:heme/copper-type cytochrome/quinol oxidase subunit 3
MMEKNRLAMLLFIFSEAVFFTLLILAYIYFHGQTVLSPGNVANLNPLRTGIFSLFLFSSSFTVWRAGKALTNKKHNQLKFWLFLTILFGVIFLVGQGIEWTDLFGLGASVSANLFGTTFFTLTGFHGLHVFIGLIMLATLLGLAQRGDYLASEAPSVDVISLYWHFVDIVWVFIFSIVYLIAAL